MLVANRGPREIIINGGELFIEGEKTSVIRFVSRGTVRQTIPIIIVICRPNKRHRLNTRIRDMHVRM